MRDSNVTNATAMRSVISMLEEQQEVFSQLLKQMNENQQEVNENHQNVLLRLQSLKISNSSHPQCVA